MSLLVPDPFLPLAAVMVSMAAVPLILLLGKWPNLREGVSLLAGLLKFSMVLALLPLAKEGALPTLRLLELAPGITLAFRADPMGIYFALVASSLWILTTLYSIGYMRGHGEKHQTRYYASFALSLSATLGIAFASNLLTFLVFYELLTLATYPLVVHKESPNAIRAGRIYLAYALSAGLLFLTATVWVHGLTGITEFREGGFLSTENLSSFQLNLLFVLFIMGVGVKAAIMPLHSWLPIAMVAPTPVSALLHAVAVVKSGAFGVLRVTGFVFGPQTLQSQGLDLWLASFAGFTILVASLIALRKDDLKARLAFSTVAHLSYIVMGTAMASASAFTGAVLHLSAHAFLKITLFFCAGAIIVHSHCTKVSQLNGLGQRMPWTFGAFAVASIGLAGIPPLNGFISKWWLVAGSMEANQPAVTVLFFLSGLLNAAYFLPIILRGFCYAPDASHADHLPAGEATPWMVVPLCITATLAVLFGMFPSFPLPFFDLAREITQSVFAGTALPLF